MTTKIVMDHAGVGAAALNSEEVRLELEARAERARDAAAAAGVEVQWAGEDRHPMPYTVTTGTGPTRVHARVTADHPAGLAAEAKFHTLAAAIDAARG